MVVSKESSLGDDASMSMSMSNSNGDTFTHRHLEKVGQYLKPTFLDITMDRSKNPWHNFIKENPDLLDVDFIVKVGT